MRTLFVLALLAIIHFSLYPWQFSAARFAARPFTWLGIGGGSDITDIIVNLAFYLLPAFIGQWAFQKPARKLRTLLLVVAGLTLLSFTVEVLQLAIPTRHANLRDVFCNAVGALIGALIASRLPRPGRLLDDLKLPPRSAPLIVFLLAFATWQAFPFLPHLRLHRLLAIPQILRDTPWSLTQLADVTLALLVLYLMTRDLNLPAFPIIGAAALLIPAQAFLREITISPSRLAAALAFLLAALFLGRPRHIHYVVLAAILTVWLLYRQLAPFDFALSQPFGWIPFRPLIEVSGRMESIRILAAKFLLYGATLWIVRRAGIPLRLAWPGLLILLAATEAAQCFLPGRTPETTDLILALLSGTSLLAGSHPTDPTPPVPAPPADP
jgi:VanZ family protein